ncbi:hypothetical protein [Dictyobacter kobayashii]|nr:hypothetical protein [Dictyobacter kobayashii]
MELREAMSRLTVHSYGQRPDLVAIDRQIVCAHARDEQGYSHR